MDGPGTTRAQPDGTRSLIANHPEVFAAFGDKAGHLNRGKEEITRFVGGDRARADDGQCAAGKGVRHEDEVFAGDGRKVSDQIAERDLLKIDAPGVWVRRRLRACVRAVRQREERDTAARNQMSDGQTPAIHSFNPRPSRLIQGRNIAKKSVSGHRM